MNYKFFTIAIVFLLFFLPACQQGKDLPGSTSNVHHVVVCWLNKPGNKEARQKVIEVSRGFSAIPGVIDVRAGRVVHSEREIYLNHPIHKKAVEETLKPLVRKVIVYDFIE